MAEEKGSTTGYSIEEAAAQLKVPPEQVHDLIAAGALKTTGSGDALRVTPDSVMLYMVSRLSAAVKNVTKRSSPLANISSAFLPLLIVAWFMAACVEIFSLRGGKPIVSVAAAAPVLAAVLAGAWWLARQTDEFSSVQGAGTTLYGKRMTSEGRVGTQWLILAGVPLLPIRSYVILESGEETSNWSGAIRKKSYQVRPLGRIYWAQVVPLLVGVWAGIAGLIALALFA